MLWRWLQYLLIILAEPQGTISIPDTGVTSITFLTHEVFSISDIFESLTFLGGHCMYNSCWSIYFPIMGSESITESFKMTSLTSDLQHHGNLTQEDKYIQLLFFFYQKCLLPFSYLCQTLPVMDHQKICISFFFVRNDLISPQNHHHQDIFFVCCIYLFVI